MEQVRRCIALLNAAGRHSLALLGGLIFINTLLEVVSIGMILPFIALLNNPNLVQTNHLVRTVYRISGMHTPNQFLVAIGIALLLLIVFKNIYLYFVTKAQFKFSFREAARISGNLFDRYLHAPYQAHLERNSSDLITTTDYSVDIVFASVVMSILVMATEASVIIGIVALMLVAEPQLTLVLIGVLGACGFALVRLMHHRLIFLGDSGLRLRIERLRILNQALFAIKELKVFGREHFFGTRFRMVRDLHADNQAEMNTLSQVPRMVIEAVVVGGLMLVIVVILLQGRATSDIISVLSLFAMAAFRVMPGINRLVVGFNAIKNGKAAVDEVCRDLEDPSLQSPTLGQMGQALQFEHAITLRDVTFTYRNAPTPALRGVSLSINRGESVGIVGTSGAGKSTLIDILMGIIEPTGGEIEVDGRNISANPASWRRLIGYVPQTISLIDDTMRHNVAFGLEENAIDGARVWQALSLARLEKHTRSMPGALDAMLGERGVRLSGGERQRVGIARALYHDPEMLIFDEATSSLDNESEHEITKAIEGLRGEKTLVIIAHRLSTVRKCDRLFVMKHGSIVASGSFDSLVASSPEFAQMVRLAELTSNADTDLALH